MNETTAWNVRRIATELVIVATAIGVSYGVVELLRYALELPATRASILAVIALAVVATRIGSTGWLQKLLGKQP